MCRRRIGFLVVLIVHLAIWPSLITACQPQPACKNVSVVVDGQRLTFFTCAATVREVLEQLKITLGPLDRVEPDLWRETVEGGTVTVVRVEVREKTERRSIPFQQRIIKSEALAPGERKLLQLGSAGEEEITYRIILEDRVERERVEALRKVIEPPVDEIIAVGMQSNLPSIPITGTLVYISGGNAWVMRDTSAGRRPLTSSGDLDGRVFALSHDGDWLLYSRVETGMPPNVLNSLWIIGTSVLNEQPQPLGIQGVVHAEWLHDGRGFIYSTAERTGGSPGWKAHNDLWRAELQGLKPAAQRTAQDTITATVKLLAHAPASELYGWWGTNFALSPDNRYVAYGRPDAVGVLDLTTGKAASLLNFAVYHTYGEWVWLPELSWSPDGQFIACSAHGMHPSGGEPEDSPVFDMWILDRAGNLQVPIVSEAGMWSAPAWSPTIIAGEKRESLIAYGVARLPRDSQNSRYDLYVMDRDGSNRRKVFPPEKWEGLVAPDLAWSPDGRLLVLAYEGNLYMIDIHSGTWNQLTADGHSGQPRWAGR